MRESMTSAARRRCGLAGPRLGLGSPLSLVLLGAFLAMVALGELFSVGVVLLLPLLFSGRCFLVDLVAGGISLSEVGMLGAVVVCVVYWLVGVMHPFEQFIFFRVDL